MQHKSPRGSEPELGPPEHVNDSALVQGHKVRGRERQLGQGSSCLLKGTPQTGHDAQPLLTQGSGLNDDSQNGTSTP